MNVPLGRMFPSMSRTILLEPCPVSQRWDPQHWVDRWGVIFVDFRSFGDQLFLTRCLKEAGCTTVEIRYGTAWHQLCRLNRSKIAFLHSTWTCDSTGFSKLVVSPLCCCWSFQFVLILDNQSGPAFHRHSPSLWHHYQTSLHCALFLKID